MGPKAAPAQAPAPAPVPAAPRQLTLPVLIFGVAEVRRLEREIEALEDFMRQATIRQPGTQQSLPRLSRLCEALASENKLNLLVPADREIVRHFLKTVELEAPKIHISFAADPSSAFTSKIVTWLRSNIQPYTLLEVGLQPVIAAGCTVRTSNKIFDLSLRERFADSEKLLLEALSTSDTPAAAIPQPVATPGVATS